MKKFKLTSEFIVDISGVKLFRIKALIEFGNVKAGDLGGYIEKEKNLSHMGNAWVSGNAQVFGNARVFGNAWVSGDAQVFGNAWVSGNAQVSGNAWVFGDAQVFGNAWVSGNAQVFGNARVFGNAWVSGDAQVFGNAWVSGDARVSGDKDYAYAHGFGFCNRTTTFFRLKDGDVGVRCGCFYGTLAQFRDNVCETHGETKKAQEYLMLADLMDFRFKN
ncbi:hypothetical protein [[Ruminococcus] torques]|uniref:hypothetical protein n=1 Tax=[Ruminococcus] torques TaxID=33039 RepID=UPI002F429D42